MASERKRLEEVYGAYERDPRTRRRWDPARPGNVAVEAERREAMREMLDAAGLWPPAGYRTLDLGCGTGGVLGELLASGASRAELVGVDILAGRLARAKEVDPGLGLGQADARDLPFADASFRLALSFTVFSSILEPAAARLVAGEIDRVLEGGGVVLWYDFRVSHPGNPNTRAVPRRSVSELFPGYQVDLRPITLVPQIARRLPAGARRAYRVLARIPFLRTHYLGLLRKPRA